MFLLSKSVLYLLSAKCLSHLKMNIYIQCCKMLHAQEKNFNKPRNPVFLMPIDIELHKASIDHFFLLTAMIISWFHGTVARTEVKHALFGPLELPSKTNLKHIFFLRVSTGFLRVRKPEVRFFF